MKVGVLGKSGCGYCNQEREGEIELIGGVPALCQNVSRRRNTRGVSEVVEDEDVLAAVRDARDWRDGSNARRASPVDRRYSVNSDRWGVELDMTIGICS